MTIFSQSTMALRKIINATFLVKKSRIFKQNLCTHHVFHAKTIADDDTKAFAIENTNEDRLSFELATSLSLSKIFIVLENRKKCIDGSHLVLAVSKFYKLSKNQSFHTKYRTQIWDSVYGKEMCSIIDTNIDKLSVSESANILKILLKMKADKSMKVIESLLKHIKDDVNKLPLVDFRTMSLVIKQMPNSSLTSDLLKTLEKRFIIQVATEFDPNNIDQLESALHFTAQNLDNDKLLELFINRLKNIEIPSRRASSIFNSLCIMKKYPEGWIDVLQNIQNILIENVDKLNTDEIMYLLYVIREKCRLEKKDYFYNEKLYDALSNKIVTHDLGFEIAISTLRNLNSIRHVNVKLMNYSCAAYFERINLSNGVIHKEFFSLITLISSLSAVKHKTPFFDQIKDRVLNDEQIADCNYEIAARLALNLIHFDYYSDKVLSRIFDDKENMEKGYSREIVCKIYQKIKTNPTYKGPLPTESQIATLKQFHYEVCINKKKTMKEQDDKILYYLEKGMGGSIYIKSNISSKLFHLIDYAVAFNKDGSPIPINSDTNEDELNSVEFVEDLKVPPGSQIVLILFLPHQWYFRNRNQLHSLYFCSLETLEAMPYPVVGIDEGMWNKTPDEEKTAMLMSKIQSRLKQD